MTPLTIHPAPPPAYTNTAAEYRAAIETAALYDHSPAGRLRAAGADALDLLNRLSTNRVDHLPPGHGAPTILTTDRGRILDLLTVVNAGPYALLLTGPGSPPAVIAWLDKYTIMEDLTVTDITADTAQFTLCGPAAGQLIAAAGLADRNQRDTMPPYAALTTNLAGQEIMLIHHPIGELPAWDLLLGDNSAAPAVWETLTAAGFVPMGQDAWDALMVSKGIPRYGRELGDDFNPLEAGLIGAIDFAKGCYIGQEVIARLDTYQKVQKHLALLHFPANIPETAGAELTAAIPVAVGAELTDGNRKVGQITSLAAQPDTGELLALAYIRAAQAQPGTQLTLAAPHQGNAEIICLPQLFGPGE